MTEKQQVFLDALFGEAKGDLRVAKSIAGYSENYSIPKIVKGLEDEIYSRTKEFISTNGPKAAFELVDIIENPAKMGNQIKLAAVRDLLDRANLGKTDKVEVKSESPLFILPLKDEDKDVETS